MSKRLTKRICKLIEEGDFTDDELHDIRAEVDGKWVVPEQWEKARQILRTLMGEPPATACPSCGFKYFHPADCPRGREIQESVS